MQAKPGCLQHDESAHEWKLSEHESKMGETVVFAYEAYPLDTLAGWNRPAARIRSIMIGIFWSRATAGAGELFTFMSVWCVCESVTVLS